MRDLSVFLAIPAAILTVLLGTTAQAQELEWPYNLPRTVKYYPEHEAHVKRQLGVERKLQWQTPVGVRKMSDDPGEKFFLDYWDFGEQDTYSEDARMANHDDLELSQKMALPNRFEAMNSSAEIPLLSALGLHSNHDRPLAALIGRHVLERAFQCPAGTTSCASIGASDLCCQNGETCVSTSGGVGCCPNGQSCGSTVASCDTGAGYTSCPNSNDGGCCVPGAACLDTGCVLYGTQTVTTTLPTATVTASASSTHSTTSSSAILSTTVISPSGSTVTVVIPGVGTTVTTTVVSPTTIVIAPSTSTTASPSSSPAACSSGFFSCPASLGGGCCPNGQGCATGTQCPDIVASSTGTASAPVRPTTVETSSVAPVSAASTVSSTSVCPTGYYMCSAVYLGGCCAVDRDCHTTSCPPTASTSVITSGVVVVAPSGASASNGASTTGASTNSAASTQSASSTGGTCRSGWYLCAAGDGGGCCPSGYMCSASCIATASGVGSQAKQAPSSANVKSAALTFLGMAVAVALGMIIL